MYFPDDAAAWKNMDPLLETPVVIWKNSQPYEGDPPHIAKQRQHIAKHLGLAVRSAAETGLSATAAGLTALADWSPLTAGFTLSTAVFGIFAAYNYFRAAQENEDLAADPAAVTWSVEFPDDPHLLEFGE